MNRVRYLFRLDDACPYQYRARWDEVLSLFSAYHIKPLIAIIPDCQDPHLCTYPYQNDFWDQARLWQRQGYPIALHGYQHVFHRSTKSRIPINRYSEFTGLDTQEQRAKIKRAWERITEKGISPAYWVAPAHSFDMTTLQVLQEETPIRIISDSFARFPFRWKGFLWIPQQLWRPRLMPAGVYTICLHPNECEEKNIEMLKSFLKRYHTLCVPWEDIAGGTYHNSGMRRCEHLFFMYAKIIKNKLTRFVK